MKKGKTIAGLLALSIAIGVAFAFKANTLPGNLYYFNAGWECVKAPCETLNNTAEPCGLVNNNFCLSQNPTDYLYWDVGCNWNERYCGSAWVTDGGR